VGIDVNKRLIMVAPSPCDKEFAHNGSVTVFCTRQAYCARDVPTSNSMFDSTGPSPASFHNKGIV
jgi:hypothetical protein